MEWNSNQDDERESNESKPILLVPAHISILWPFSAQQSTVWFHTSWGTGGFQQGGIGDLNLSTWRDLLPVIDRMITAKHDLSPCRKWNSETSGFKGTETERDSSPGKIIPLNLNRNLLVLLLWLDKKKWPLWEHSAAVYISGSQCKCLHHLLTVLESADSRSLQSLKSGSRRSDSIPWLTLSFSHTLSHTTSPLSPPPHLSLSLHPFLILFFATKLCLWGVGKWAEQRMWGFEDHLELGAGVFVAQPAGHIKGWGRVW